MFNTWTMVNTTALHAGLAKDTRLLSAVGATETLTEVQMRVDAQRKGAL